MIETSNQFEARKRDHIDLALKSENQACGGSGFEQVDLLHEALPELDLQEVELKSQVLGEFRPVPFFVSSMTAGHKASVDINLRLAKAAAHRQWLMGVGSQRRELFDLEAAQEWRRVRREVPSVKLLGNIGLSQAIHSTTDQLKTLVSNLEAVALIVHLNPLQECLQREGTPNFKGGLRRLAELARELPVPLVVKETGCGFSQSTLARLGETEVKAVDVSGYGGTHWGRIEGQRQPVENVQSEASKTFAGWGVSTFESLVNAREVKPTYEVWASGGIRTGLEAAKALALGASAVGFGQPLLEAALNSEEALDLRMNAIEFELKTALFCTGCRSIEDLQSKKVLKWR